MQAPFLHRPSAQLQHDPAAALLAQGQSPSEQEVEWHRLLPQPEAVLEEAGFSLKMIFYFHIPPLESLSELTCAYLV